MDLRIGIGPIVRQRVGIVAGISERGNGRGNATPHHEGQQAGNAQQVRVDKSDGQRGTETKAENVRLGGPQITKQVVPELLRAAVEGRNVQIRRTGVIEKEVRQIRHTDLVQVLGGTIEEGGRRQGRGIEI